MCRMYTSIINFIQFPPFRKFNSCKSFPISFALQITIHYIYFTQFEPRLFRFSDRLPGLHLQWDLSCGWTGKKIFGSIPPRIPPKDSLLFEENTFHSKWSIRVYDSRLNMSYHYLKMGQATYQNIGISSPRTRETWTGQIGCTIKTSTLVINKTNMFRWVAA